MKTATDPTKGSTTSLPLRLALVKARAHMDATEQSWFAGNCRLDVVRSAYLELQRCERLVTEAQHAA